ncbi:MAG: YhhN family protein [Bacteroidota bacterium]|nr:YhhN family protein [Bacteroidota bacterium]
MIFLLLYFLDGLLNLFAEWFSSSILIYVTKVLLMPLLMLYLRKTSGSYKNRRFIFAALFFSWLGDIFLMFPRNEYAQNIKQLLFICGLIAFLLAHLNYIISFSKDIYSVKKASIIVQNPYMIIPFALYLFFLLRFLSPYLGFMKLPVYIYGSCITLMLVTAFNRKNIASDHSFYLIFTGALLFIISDTLLSINIFYKKMEWQRIAVMLTYILAQGFIVMGVSSETKKKAI